MLALALIVGIPTGLVGGPMYARWIAKRMPVEAPIITVKEEDTARPRPGVAATGFVVALPIVLMLLSTAGELLFPPANPVRTALAFIGHPVFALVVAVFVSLWVFGRACRFTRAQNLAFTEQSVAAIGVTLMVVAGGGGFARVLREAGVAGAMGTLAGNLQVPPLIYGWIVAAFIRVATGSATVAITTAAGLLGPVLAANPAVNRELLVLSLGFGSLFLSHLNDGGFWIVKECLGMTVGQTLRTWSVIESILGVVGLGFTLLLATVI